MVVRIGTMGLRLRLTNNQATVFNCVPPSNGSADRNNQLYDGAVLQRSRQLPSRRLKELASSGQILHNQLQLVNHGYYPRIQFDLSPAK